MRRGRRAALLAACALGVASGSAYRGFSELHQLPEAPAAAGAPRPGSANCTWGFFEQPLDHFAPGNTEGHSGTLSQRYCVYSGFYRADGDAPVLLYVGNESPVEVYVDNTGLMWEFGREQGALLVWAEHRYEGESVPAVHGVENCVAFCSSKQALADYARLVQHLRLDLAIPESTAFVALGGSYGGMLAAWMRLKYPGTIAGAIAASAPVWGLPLTYPPLTGSFRVVTRSLGEEGGAPNSCRDNLLGAWPLVQAILGTGREGRALAADELRLCRTPASAQAVVEWLSAPWFNLAEANFPFASNYVTKATGGPDTALPAWPMRVACDALGADIGVSMNGSAADVSFAVTMGSGSSAVTVRVDWDRLHVEGGLTAERAERAGARRVLAALRDAVGVWYNVTGDAQCFDLGGAASAPAAEALAGEAGASASSVSRALGGGREMPHGRSRGGARSYEGGSWPLLVCQEDMHLINYLVRGTGEDAFWPPTAPRNYTQESLLGPLGGAARGCPNTPLLSGFPKEADPWARELDAFYGGDRAWRFASNIVFSNGLLDPWAAGGVFPEGFWPPMGGKYAGDALLPISADGSVAALIIDLGAHHLDLFFTTPEDPPSVTAAREEEKRRMLSWAEEWRKAFQGRGS